MTTVLCTGGAGYIGSQCVRALTDAGHAVVVFDNLSTGRADLLPAGTPVVTGDVRDGEALRRCLVEHEVEAVLHFAGLISVPRSFERPAEYDDVNAGGMLQLLRAAEGTALRWIVFSSTAAVYAPCETPIAEDGAKEPASPYGLSKLKAEQALEDGARRLGLGWAVLRYFNVAGADPQARGGPVDPGAEDLFRRALACAAGEIEALDVFGDDYPTVDGTGVRDFIHVADLAALHLAALGWLEREGSVGGAFNCGYGQGSSVMQVIEAVRRATGADVPTRVAPRRPGDLAQVVADSRKAAEIFGWTPLWNDIDAMAGHAWAWRRQGHEARK